MKMTEPEKSTEPDIDALLAECARVEIRPPAALVDRIVRASVLAAGHRGRSRGATGRGRLGRLYAELGGWPMAAGLVGIAIVGGWLGFSPPGFLDVLADGLLFGSNGVEPADLMISLDNVLGAS